MHQIDHVNNSLSLSFNQQAKEKAADLENCQAISYLTGTSNNLAAKVL